VSKLARIAKALEGKDHFVLGFSGGLDSLFLACYLRRLGKDFCLVTVDHGMLPDPEAVKRSAEEVGVSHHVLPLPLLEDKTFIENTPERCYFCKKRIIETLREFQEREGYDYILDASNLSDLKDYISGVIALKEEAVLLPLMEAEVTKEEIREFSRELGIEVRPPESCLATRIPAYIWIRKEAVEKLRRIERKIRGLGFSLVRARTHESLLRLQFLEAEMERAVGKKEEILRIVREEGFEFATLDLASYTSSGGTQ
jgi:uncharacterized protein